MANASSFACCDKLEGFRKSRGSTGVRPFRTYLSDADEMPHGFVTQTRTGSLPRHRARCRHKILWDQEITPFAAKLTPLTAYPFRRRGTRFSPSHLADLRGCLRCRSQVFDNTTPRGVILPWVFGIAAVHFLRMALRARQGWLFTGRRPKGSQYQLVFLISCPTLQPSLADISHATLLICGPSF